MTHIKLNLMDITHGINSNLTGVADGLYEQLAEWDDQFNQLDSQRLQLEQALNECQTPDEVLTTLRDEQWRDTLLSLKQVEQQCLFINQAAITLLINNDYKERELGPPIINYAGVAALRCFINGYHSLAKQAFLQQVALLGCSSTYKQQLASASSFVNSKDKFWLLRFDTIYNKINAKKSTYSFLTKSLFQYESIFTLFLLNTLKRLKDKDPQTFNPSDFLMTILRCPILSACLSRENIMATLGGNKQEAVMVDINFYHKILDQSETQCLITLPVIHNIIEKIEDDTKTPCMGTPNYQDEWPYSNKERYITLAAKLLQNKLTYKLIVANNNGRNCLRFLVDTLPDKISFMQNLLHGTYDTIDMMKSLHRTALSILLADTNWLIELLTLMPKYSGSLLMYCVNNKINHVFEERYFPCFFMESISFFERTPENSKWHNLFLDLAELLQKKSDYHPILTSFGYIFTTILVYYEPSLFQLVADNKTFLANYPLENLEKLVEGTLAPVIAWNPHIAESIIACYKSEDEDKRVSANNFLKQLANETPSHVTNYLMNGCIQQLPDQGIILKKLSRYMLPEDFYHYLSLSFVSEESTRYNHLDLSQFVIGGYCRHIIQNQLKDLNNYIIVKVSCYDGWVESDFEAGYKIVNHNYLTAHRLCKILQNCPSLKSIHITLSNRGEKFLDNKSMLSQLLQRLVEKNLKVRLTLLLEILHCHHDDDNVFIETLINLIANSGLNITELNLAVVKLGGYNFKLDGFNYAYDNNNISFAKTDYDKNKLKTNLRKIIKAIATNQTIERLDISKLGKWAGETSRLLAAKIVHNYTLQYVRFSDEINLKSSLMSIDTFGSQYFHIWCITQNNVWLFKRMQYLQALKNLSALLQFVVGHCNSLIEIGDENFNHNEFTLACQNRQIVTNIMTQYGMDENTIANIMVLINNTYDNTNPLKIKAIGNAVKTALAKLERTEHETTNHKANQIIKNSDTPNANPLSNGIEDENAMKYKPIIIGDYKFYCEKSTLLVTLMLVNKAVKQEEEIIKKIQGKREQIKQESAKIFLTEDEIQILSNIKLDLEVSQGIFSRLYSKMSGRKKNIYFKYPSQTLFSNTEKNMKIADDKQLSLTCYFGEIARQLVIILKFRTDGAENKVIDILNYILRLLGTLATKFNKRDPYYGIFLIHKNRIERYLNLHKNDLELEKAYQPSMNITQSVTLGESSYASEEDRDLSQFRSLGARSAGSR